MIHQFVLYIDCFMKGNVLDVRAMYVYNFKGLLACFYRFSFIQKD